MAECKRLRSPDEVGPTCSCPEGSCTLGIQEQLDLDFYNSDDEGLTIQERFERFDRENPIVYMTLLRLAYEAKAAGAKKIGVRTLWEVMRWHIFMQTRDPSGLKLNDHYHSRYVRKIVEDRSPDFDGFFELRKLRAP